MKTAEQIISYLEEELAGAYALYEVHRGKQATEAYAYLLKATTIEQLLASIKEG